MTATANRIKTTRRYAGEDADRIVAHIPTHARSVQMLHEDDGSARFRAHIADWTHVVRAVARVRRSGFTALPSRRAS